MDKATQAISPWAAHLARQLHTTPAIFEKQLNTYTVGVVPTKDTLAICVSRANGAKLAFRTAYSPAADLKLVDSKTDDTALSYTLESVIGTFTVDIYFEPADDMASIRYAVHITPNNDLYMPFWPKDLLALNQDGGIGNTAGRIHVAQKGIRSGLVYFSIPEPDTGGVLYLQNLTALNNYCIDTGTSLSDTVTGGWPELGFTLPATKDRPLQKGKAYCISEALVAFSADTPANQFDTGRQFVDLLAQVYLHLPQPATRDQDYTALAKKALKDLEVHHGCWSYHHRHMYLNAYVSDYKTPPEIMVQLALLLPLLEYQAWMGRDISIACELRAGLPNFFDESIGVICRWLPAERDQLDGSEEHKKPFVMDSWYLHHPLLNLSRMALRGDEAAKDLFLKSIDYAIKVAHRFNYQWPVFYKMDTLEVIKPETEPGKGGEKDVAGIYAHVMLQAWELTGEKRFLNEAKKAAKSLLVHGFDLFYQANNTAFSAGAMLRLWKETDEDVYLDLSFLLMANVFKNIALWSCGYGYGPNFPLFFAVFPLNDAPYTAAYEEFEVLSAVYEFLNHADEVPLPRSLALLLAEFVRHALHRMVYYYPARLPAEMVTEEPKTGHIDANLWVPLEDINDGWEKAGVVGQEVYGAGVPFSVVPRHYIKILDGRALVFIEYPTAEVVLKKSELRMKVLGDGRMACKLYVISGDGEGELTGIAVSGRRQGVIKPVLREGRTVYEVEGNQHVVIKWNR